MKFPVILYEWSHLLLKIISACFAGFHLLPISLCPTYLSFLASFEHLPLTSQWHMALSSFLSVFIPWVISVHPSFTYHPYTDDAYLSSFIHDSFHKFQPSVVCHLLYYSVSFQVCHTGSLYLIRLRHIAPSPAALLVTLFYILCNPFHDILFCTMKAEKLQLNLSKLPYRQSSLWNSSSAHQISLHRLRLGMELYDAYTVTVHDKGHRFLIPWLSSVAVALLQSWQRESDAKSGAFSQKAQHECWSSSPAEAFVCYLIQIMKSVSAGTSQNGLCRLQLNPNQSSLELYPSNKLLLGLIALPRAKHIALVSFLHFSHIPLQSMSTPSKTPDVITPASTILLPPNRFPCFHHWYFTTYYFIVHWPATLIW